jgi:CRISPR-associated protein (TIGR02584 family)
LTFLLKQIRFPHWTLGGFEPVTGPLHPQSEMRRQSTAHRPQTASPSRRFLDSPARPVVLFAVAGLSPAILTETVWALAHERPAIIPDRIVVVTTHAGREAIRRELFGWVAQASLLANRRPNARQAGMHAPRCIWDQLRDALTAKIRGDSRSFAARLRFGPTADDIRVFTRADARGRSVELEDIRTPADNEAAADFLLDKLREFTENEDVRLVCSLAGGRKTMGALLYACLSLIGREGDRLTHVLVNEPFDDPRLQPRFYFPTRPPTLHQKSEVRGQKSQVSSAKARIELADVPFVPLRKLFPRELGRMPGRFMNLVAQYRSAIEQLAVPPRVELSEDEPVVRVEAVPVKLPATAFALLSFLVQRARRGEPPYGKQQEALEPFRQWLGPWRDGRPPFDFRNDGGIKNLERDGDLENLRKLVNTLKTRLQQAGVAPAACQHLLPQKGRFGIRIRL